MRNKISFEITEVNGGALSVTPCIDGTPLTTLVGEFSGALERYFCGQAGNQDESDNEEIYVLGCECGEVGCWPLVTSVTRVEGGYRWATFRQPHRPQRNYGAFGPFVFEKGQYEEAVRDAAFRSELER